MRPSFAGKPRNAYHAASRCFYPIRDIVRVVKGTAFSWTTFALRFRQWAGFFAGLLGCAALLLLPAPAEMPLAAWRAAAVGLLMAVWWMTEAIPISATALLPLALFPLLGVADIRAASAPYANPLVFLFLGGFLIAAGMQRWNLHRRLALRIIARMGPHPYAILAGFMIAAAFLSMWVSNTATALMMLPIGLSVAEFARRADARNVEHFTVSLMLIIAYSCSIGGVATLVGTPPNAFFAGFVLETYDISIGFAEWMQIGLPLILIALPATYFVLTRVVYPINMKEIPGGAAFIDDELAAMGRMSRAEKMVMALFALAATLWMTRPLLAPLVPGLSDAGIAMGVGLLFFLLPVDAAERVFLLEWKDAERLPWGLLVLFGGGLSLAAAINDTGLAAWFGAQAGLIEGWPVFAIILVIASAIIFLTELTSNIATVAAFLPVAASIGVGLGESPLLFAVPAVLAASCAFMLPVATPPNAIVYSSEYVTIPRMARAGILLNILFIFLVSLVAYLLIPLVDLG